VTEAFCDGPALTLTASQCHHSVTVEFTAAYALQIMAHTRNKARSQRMRDTQANPTKSNLCLCKIA
jgi:hypothetical protein